MKVAVLMGGVSAEREVSLRSGVAVANALRQFGHQVSEIDVAGPDFILARDNEAAFVALHGSYGEDGQVQAELEKRGLPYTGSDAEASRLAFDKRLSKRVFDRRSIPTPEWRLARAGERPLLPWPVVVKPPCQGSTIGVQRVDREADWNLALQKTLRYDDEAVVERFVEGRELTVGLLDGQALEVVEIVAPDGWYDYGAKYVPGRTEYRVPAPLDAERSDACKELARKVSVALGCHGVGRVDLRMRPDGVFYVLEINTIPGLTATSLLPMSARHAGLEFPELCDRILKTAFNRNPEQRKAFRGSHPTSTA